jgi:hypothetical protein
MRLGAPATACVLVAAIVAACGGSTDCKETATCGVAGDGAAPDGGADGHEGSDATTDGSGSSSGSDGSGSSSGNDSGKGSDAGGGGDGAAGDGGITGDPTTCAEAAQLHSYVGCEFWPTVTSNSVWSIFDFAAVVANGGATTAVVTVTGPGGTNEALTVGSGQLTKIYLPWVTALKGPDNTNCGQPASVTASVLATGAAYHLVSSVPVTVYQFSALEYVGAGGPTGKDWSSCPGDTVCPLSLGPIGCYSFSNDASLLLPTAAMTGNYWITGHGGWAPGMLGAYATVTATANDTTLHMRVSSTGSILAGTGVTATAAGGILTLSMNAGDVAELVGAPTDASDLSGSLITASQPIQVITGLSCLDVPDTAPACDHVEESNFPAETLGADYVVAQPTGPHGVVVGHVLRIYGTVDGTTLTYDPSAPAGCPSTIDAGQVVECGVVDEDFEVKGTNAFAVGIFTQGGSVVDPSTMAPNQEGDPDQSMATPVAEFRTKYVFLAPTDYEENYVVVIEPTGAAVTLDGAAVTTAATPVGTSGYEVVRLPLSAGAAAGEHELVSTQPLGVQVMGYGAYTSYQYPGGLDLQSIAPSPPQVQ